MSTIHVIPRSELPANDVVTFEAFGLTCLVADIEGDVEAFSVAGSAARYSGRAAIADGHLLCPLHGWPIDNSSGGCGVGTRCRAERLAVEDDGREIRVILPHGAP